MTHLLKNLLSMELSMNRKYIKVLIIVLTLFILCSCKDNSVDNRIKEINNKYGINIFYDVDPYSIYDKDNTHSVSFSFDKQNKETLLKYIDILDDVLSTLNIDTYKDLPDVYYASSSDMYGLAYRGEDYNFIIINLDKNNDHIESVYYHELFHVLTSYYDEGNDEYKMIFEHLDPYFFEKYSWIEEDSIVISEYAKTNLLEEMAEAFCESINRYGIDDNEYFRIMRGYAWPTILNEEYINSKN